MDSLRMIDQWPVENAATAVIAADGRVLGRRGDTTREFPLASVTKPMTAYAALIAVEEGAIELDTPAGPPGSTVRHLLAHTSGLSMTEPKILARPGQRRLYSNLGFEQLADLIAEHTEIPFAEYLTDAVLTPLNMSATRLAGSPAAGAVSTVEDLALFAAELQSPTLVAAETFAAATSVVFPDLAGVLPGLGYQKTNDWGLGFEIRDHKDPHWTGATSSPATFGHFGQSGTFIWVDPVAGAACVAVTDRDFGAWATRVWPTFTDAVLAELPTALAEAPHA